MSEAFNWLWKNVFYMPQAPFFLAFFSPHLKMLLLPIYLLCKKCLFLYFLYVDRWNGPFSCSLSLAEQAVTISDSLQMDVVNAFQSGSSIQGALRRQPSIASQHHDVTNISTPTHVVFSSSTASTTVGCECVFLSA